MKLLFDGNLSHKLAERLSDLFPSSTHVALIGLERAGDRAVWDFAIEHEFLIVSKDEDFHQLAFLLGPPPKVVWLRLGNCTTDEVEAAMRRYGDRIAQFAADELGGFLVLGTPE